jgi:hypothetical protein
MLKHVKTPFHSWDLMRVLDCQALFSEFHSLKMLRASPQSPAWSRRHPSLVDKSMRCIVKKMFSYGYFWVEQNDVTWSIWHNQIQKKSQWQKSIKESQFPGATQILTVPLYPFVIWAQSQDLLSGHRKRQPLLDSKALHLNRWTQSGIWGKPHA